LIFSRAHVSDAITRLLAWSQARYGEARKCIVIGFFRYFLIVPGIQLYEDLSTWRSELKKNVVVIASTIPGLVPPSNIPPQERASWVEGAAAGLKAGSKFLRDGVDEQVC
jgi:hypothetical protein